VDSKVDIKIRSFVMGVATPSRYRPCLWRWFTAFVTALVGYYI
tara:strand:+ start:818 stop:946 length:129 start_codon:yes stop_codon:yes gene_type:complete